MALRKIARLANAGATRAAVVYKDMDWSEFRVKFYEMIDGKLTHLVDADYHTDDKLDAFSTAALVVGV